MSEEFANWLEGLGLGQYAEAFAENAIDLRTLPALTEADLKELGLKLGHRRLLQQAIEKLSGDSGQSSELQSSSDTGISDTDTSLAAWERHPGERKPVTMLFADITGSTALTEKLDAEEAHDLLYGATQRMCEAIENNRGTVCRFMGDGVMAMFGAPMASEQHAVDACEAALQMQQAARDYANNIGARHGSGLQIRVGLHSGEVVVLTVGEGGKVEYDASGPTVPIAARMEQASEPGEIYLTAATHSLAEDRIEAQPLEPVSVKGISDPVAVFALRRVRSLEEGGVRTTRTPFVGRRAELIQFRGMLDACIGDGLGETVYVRGDAGIGKTRLVEEFMRLAAAKGMACHRGLVLDFGVGKGQDSIRTVVRSLLSVEFGSGKFERQKAADTGIDGKLLDPEQRVYLNDLLDLPQPTELRALYDAMDNATRNQGKQAVVAGLVTTVSSNEPILIVVEDVHWAEPITLAHLANLAKTVAECPALLVMTSRIERDPLDQTWRSSTEGSPFVTIDLGPLRRKESMALIGEFVDSNEQLAKSCLERAAGNPLFLEQLLRNAEESSGESLPDSIQSLVLARMDRLEPADKRALQAASVIGQRFEGTTLRYMLQIPTYDCQPLLEHNLVRVEGAAYLFAHALIQAGVYGSLLKRQRRDLHVRAAEWFADNDLVLQAQHLDRADDPRAPGAYLEAATAQSRQYRAQHALRLVERGLELAQSNADCFELNCLNGEFLQHLGSVAESMTCYRRALEIADEDGQRCRARLGLAAGMRVMDQLDEALKALELAESEASAKGLKSELARIHHLRGNLYFPLGNIDGCLEQQRLALQYAREVESPELEALAMGGLGDAFYAQGRLRTAHDNFVQCLDISRRHGFGRIEVANWPMIAGTLHYLNESNAAFKESLAVLSAVQRVGHQRAEIQANFTVGMAYFYLGEWDRAKSHIERSLAVGRRLGARRFWARSMQYMARIFVAEGRRSDAVPLLEDALAISRETGIRYVGAVILGTLALATDDPETRQRALSEGEKILREGCLSHNYFEFYTDALETCLNVGDWNGAERYASALENYTRNEPLPLTDFLIARGRALTAFARGERDDATMQELRHLCDEAEGWISSALPALEEALASVDGT